MKRKDDEKERTCSSSSKLDPIPLDLKMARVTRLPSVHLGEAKKRKERDYEEEDEKDATNPSKLELDSLPLDLKMAILTRVPAKSLTKLRCVSKMWSSIIRSRGFIDSYYAMSSRQSRFIVGFSNGVFGTPEERLTFFFSFSHDEGQESSSLLPTFEMAVPTYSFNNHTRFLASFHGILAVLAGTKWLLCNPSTEQVLTFPANIAFVCYDPIDDQYKALDLDNKIWEDPSAHLKHKVLTLGGGQAWRHIQGTPLPYRASESNVCINGFLYYAASLTKTDDTVMVCFDVRSEKLSFINAPKVVAQWGRESVFIEYKGKLASIVRDPYGRANSFDLWILEDVEKHEWSKQTCVFPSSFWDDIDEFRGIRFPGTNKAGEIIIAPKNLSRKVQPFYIFYYNVETQNLRRVRLLGIGDSEEFRRSYGFGKIADDSLVMIAHQHVESVGFL
ncbi:unnamed protein product [Arabidopsis halleri]